MADIKYRASLDTSNFDAGSNKMKGQISSMDGMFGKMVGAMSVTNIAGKALSGAFNFGKHAIEQLKSYEYFSASLRTMMHGDKYGAMALNEQLVKLAANTPFSLQDVQTGTKNLMAYGFQAGEITKNLTMIGNVSSGVGAPLNDIIYLYGTLRASGRVTLMDLRQFAGRGIPIYETLAKTLGKNVSEIGKLATAGKIGFKDVEKAFQSMTNEGGQFFNLMEVKSKTVGGQIDNMSDAFDQFSLHTMESRSGLLKDLTSWATTFIQTLDKGVQLSNKARENIEAGNKYNKEHGFGETKSKEPWLISYFKKLSSDEFKNSQLLDQAKKRFNVGGYSGTTFSKEQYQEFLGLSSSKNGGGLGLYQDKRFLQKELANMENATVKAKIKGLGSVSYFAERSAQVKGALLEVEGKIESWRKGIGPTKKDPNAPPDDEGAAALPTEYRGNKPQTINININEVNGIKTATINSAAETIEQSKENLSAALLEAISDLHKIINTQ